jgi:FkbM family methyltransferase
MIIERFAGQRTSHKRQPISGWEEVNDFGPLATETGHESHNRPPGILHPRILTTYRKGNTLAWLQRVDVMEDFDAEVARNWNKRLPVIHQLVRDAIWACKVFSRSRRYDAIVTGSDRMSRLFAILQLLLRRRRVPHVYIDWYCNLTGGRLKRWLQRVELKWAILGASRAIVQGSREIEGYADELGVSPSKFVFLPYHATLYGVRFEEATADYIFAGGDSNRDYSTLIEAVRGIPYRTVIAALRRDHFRGIDIPENVEIVTLDQSEFFRKMAGAALVVVPLLPGLMHAGGQQTWINAMSMGKPVIVAEDLSASDYIAHGSTGWLVEPGKPSELREAICLLMQDHEIRSSIGRNAKGMTARFSPERFCEAVLDATETCIKEVTLNSTSAKFWHLTLLAYGRLPNHPGKWRIFERIWPKTQGVWQEPSIVQRCGMRLEVDRRDFLGRYVYYIGYEVEETRFLEEYVKPGWVVADVGANIGYFTMLLARLVGPTGIVHAFEPAAPAYEVLLRNSKLNYAENVRAHKIALGGSTGVVPLAWGPAGNSGKTQLGRSGGADEHVSLTTLEQFVEQHNLARLDLLKVDIEGSELRFLEGAISSLRRFRPIILLEINGAALAAFGAHPEQVLRFLTDLGYQILIPTLRGSRPLRSLSEMAKYDFFNVIAMPVHA